MRFSDESRLLISLGWSWAHHPVISLLPHLSCCILDSDSWVSRRKDATTMCNGSRLWFTPGWSWAHHPVISLLHHLSGCISDSEWWVSRRSDTTTICDRSILLISLHWSWVHLPVISLLSHLSGRMLDPDWWVSRESDGKEHVWWEQILDLTWLILSASASDLALSASIWSYVRFRVVSV